MQQYPPEPPDLKEDSLANEIIETFKASQARSEELEAAHQLLRSSAEYQAELLFLRQTIHDFISTLRACVAATWRWTEFSERFLLPTHLDDIVEAAITAHLSIENGALNPARRELRYMLEVAVNTAFVDEARATEPLEERIRYYRSVQVDKSSVQHIYDLPLRLLGENKLLFATEVKNAWVRASNYVHLTKRRIDEKMKLRELGITLGFETIGMLENVVSEVHLACSMVLILAFETIGPDHTADLLVNALDGMDSWSFHASGFVAAVDTAFDSKNERSKDLASIQQRRNSRIRFPIHQSCP